MLIWSSMEISGLSGIRHLARTFALPWLTPVLIPKDLLANGALKGAISISTPELFCSTLRRCVRGPILKKQHRFWTTPFAKSNWPIRTLRMSCCGTNGFISIHTGIFSVYLWLIIADIGKHIATFKPAQRLYISHRLTNLGM